VGETHGVGAGPCHHLAGRESLAREEPHHGVGVLLPALPLRLHV
jgi:hypothetical protein